MNFAHFKKVGINNKMKYNKKTDRWIGTPIEHIRKLLETHDCMCDKVRLVLQVIVDGKTVIAEKELKSRIEGK